MTPEHFFETTIVDIGDGFPPVEQSILKRPMVERLREGPLDDRDDLAVAAALTEMLHKEFEAYGTDGGERLSDTEARIVLRSLRASLRRVGIDFSLPWRDFTTFRSHWIREGCSGSWQARRDLLDTHFEPIHQRLSDLEDQAFAGELAEAVSPHGVTGWPSVDAEIRELRKRFHSSVTPQDYRAIGTHCVGVLEALSRVVYDPARHLKPGESVPPVDRTKQRLGRYVETELAGSAQETFEDWRSKQSRWLTRSSTGKHPRDVRRASLRML